MQGTRSALHCRFCKGGPQTSKSIFRTIFCSSWLETTDCATTHCWHCQSGREILHFLCCRLSAASCRLSAANCCPLFSDGAQPHQFLHSRSHVAPVAGGACNIPLSKRKARCQRYQGSCDGGDSRLSGLSNKLDFTHSSTNSGRLMCTSW